jgi:hypothetical protein
MAQAQRLTIGRLRNGKDSSAILQQFCSPGRSSCRARGESGDPRFKDLFWVTLAVAETFLAAGLRRQRQKPMRQILEVEEHVAVPPMMYSDPFYRITYLIKEEIRKHKWLKGEKGRRLSWKEARAEWTRAHREQYEISKRRTAC